MAAGDVAFAGDALADLETLHLAADLRHHAHEFVAHGHGHGDGLLRPGVPVVDVDVGAADGGLLDLDEQVVGPDLGFGHVLQPDAFGLRETFRSSTRSAFIMSAISH